MASTAIWYKRVIRNLPAKITSGTRRAPRSDLRRRRHFGIWQGANIDDAIIDHDSKLDQLLKRCVKSTSSSTKTVCLQSNTDTFLGHVITSEGLQRDPKKVADVLGMPPPSDVEGVQRLGWIRQLPEQVFAQPLRYPRTNPTIDKAGYRVGVVDRAGGCIEQNQTDGIPSTTASVLQPQGRAYDSV